jgi:hypothetical protein
MTDQELSAVVAELAASEFATPAGFNTIFNLMSILDAEPEFAGLPPRTVRSDSGGAHTTSSNFVAQVMLDIARTSHDSAAAVSWLRKLPTLNQGGGAAIKALYGINCSERIAISDDIALIPFVDLPASTTRDWLFEHHQRPNGLVGGYVPTPLAALYRAGSVERLTVDADEDYSNSAPAIWFKDLDTAAFLLTLIPKAVPIEAARWFHYEDPDVARLCRLGVARHGSELRPSQFVHPPLVSQASVAGLVSGYGDLKKGDKNRIDLALQQILRARCQSSPGNRAIDLAIALEVLFMAREREEISHKISLRVARLLRTSLADRCRMFAEVKGLYGLRSSMVHGGSASPTQRLNGEQRSAFDLVESVDVICTESIRKFLSLGGIPKDWRDIELSSS